MCDTSSSSSRLVNCLPSSSPSLQAVQEENISMVLLTNVIFDHPQYHTTTEVVDPMITGNILDRPEILWKIKENPSSCRENLRIDNIEVMKREIMELLSVKSPSSSEVHVNKSIYLVDISDTDNLSSLYSLSKLLPSSTSFNLAYSSKALPSIHSSDRVPESLSSRLQAQLIVGDSLLGPAGASSLYVRSGCLKCQIGGSPFHVNSTFMESDKIQLAALCKVQREVQTKYPLCNAPLLVIGCGPFFAFHSEVLSFVRDNGGSLVQVLLNQVVISFS